MVVVVKIAAAVGCAAACLPPVQPGRALFRILEDPRSHWSHLMHAWRGWAAASETRVKTAPTWDEWRACQQRNMGSETCEQARPRESSPFSDGELTRLSFVRWLYHTGRLDPAETDND